MPKHVAMVVPGAGVPACIQNGVDVHVIEVEEEDGRTSDRNVVTVRMQGSPLASGRHVRRLDPYRISEDEDEEHDDERGVFHQGLSSSGDKLARPRRRSQRWEVSRPLLSPLRRNVHQDETIGAGGGTGRRRGRGGRSNSSNRSINRSPLKITQTAQPHEAVSPPSKPPLETPERQLELYRSLQKRKFLTLHEELHHLRVSYIHAQKTLQLRSEEVARFRKELVEKNKVIERLRSLLAVMRKERLSTIEHAATVVNDDTADDNNNNIDAENMTPSLTLFAATAVDGGGNRGGRGPATKLLQELRQNIASRDTTINGLRMELSSVRRIQKEADEKIKTLEAELKETRAQCDSLSAEVVSKDKIIEELQNSSSVAADHASEEDSSTITSGGGGNSNRVRTNFSDMMLPLRRQLEEYRQQNRLPDDVMEGIRKHLQRLEESPGSYSPPNTTTTAADAMMRPHLWQEKDGLCNELMRLRECLHREEETRVESERLWRRRHEADMRMVEAELVTSKAEVEAYRRELERMQKQITSAGFLEAQLQTARNENDALQQRLHELREENISQSSREKELLNELRLTKEAHDRREDEAASLQRRLRAFRKSETELREEIETLEGRLRAETASSQEPSSYAALMALNADLQDRLKALETDLQKAKEEKSPEIKEIKDDGGGDVAVAVTPPESNSSGVLVGRFVQLSKRVEDLKTKLHLMQTFLHKLQGQFPALYISSEQLHGEFKSVRDAYSALSYSWDEVTEELRELNDSGRVILEEDTNKSNNDEVTRKTRRTSGVRNRLQDVQRHAIMTADAPDALDALRAEVSRLSEALRKSEEELLQTRMELVTARAELDVMRQQQAAHEGLLHGIGERKVSSLRAARLEAAHWQQQVSERETAMEELRRECEEQRRIIATLIESSQPPPTDVSPSSAVGFAFPDGVSWNDDRIIEEALRDETARLDEEMNTLRRKLRAMKRERDHWKSLAGSASKEVT